jgi:hypothetical protein
VHCKAGLGRTGTLIGLELMRTHGFTAREAMGWLRMMRPGSVIGEQQQYLVASEQGSMGDLKSWTALGSTRSTSSQDKLDVAVEEDGRFAEASSAQLAADVWAGAERRGMERWRRSASSLSSDTASSSGESTPEEAGGSSLSSGDGDEDCASRANGDAPLV